MFKVELSYNPYLLETRIRFNGQEPRINSLVEKYQDGSLQKWVDRIPKIFHDEMNGYDFELEFSGTERDFQEVTDAFRRKGVSEEEVPIFHKNELGSRKEKLMLIDQLISWLGENRNRNFDFDNFQNENAELLNDSYEYIVFQGSQLDTETILDEYIPDECINVEYIDSVEELENTDLSGIPVLLYLSKENLSTFQENLEWFIYGKDEKRKDVKRKNEKRKNEKRKDVEKEQLFFLIDPDLDAGKVERIIQDLGIREPGIVESVWNPSIQKYMELYPVSEHIHSVITRFRTEAKKLSERLQEQSEQCALANKEIHDQIDRYEGNIRRLKDAHSMFVNRDNIEIPNEWDVFENTLLSLIRSWKKRKTKITNYEEAVKAAGALEADVKAYFQLFFQDIRNSVQNKKQEIDTKYDLWYRSSLFDQEYQKHEIVFYCPEYTIDLDFADDLMKLFTEEYVQPKEERFGLFFKNSSDTSKEPLLQRTYYYQNWRQYAEELISPKEAGVISAFFNELKKYEQTLADSYMERLTKLLEEQTRLKDQEAAKLSDEERLLQDDIDWLVEVQDQLNKIVRD